MKVLIFLAVLLALVNYGHSQILASMGDEVYLVEGGAGSFPVLVFPVYLSAPVLTSSNVTFSVVAGTATSGVDYLSPLVTTVTFLAGSSEEVIRVPIVGDTTVESTETFDVILTGGTGVTISFPFASRGYIVNDDGTSATMTSQTSIREALGQMTFTVTLSAASSVATSFSYRAYSRSTDTATPGVDYDNVDTTGTIAAGQLSTTIAVAIFDDTLPESDETFTIEVYSPNNMWFLNSTNGATEVLRSTFTILDDDITVSVSDVSLAEGTATNTSFVFTVSLSKALTTGQSAIVAVSLAHITTDASDFSDLSFENNNLTFASGDQSKTITVGVFGDAVIESTETFEIQTEVLDSSPVGVITPGFKGVGTGTIINDDSTLSLTFTRSNPNNTIQETTGSIVFTVTPTGTNTGGPAGAFTVNVDSITALNAVDFTTTLSSNNLLIATQTVTWAAGQVPATFTFTVTTLADNLVEPDELFNVTLTNLNSVTATQPTSWVYTLQDSTIALTVGDAVSVMEGNGGSSASNYLVFPISLSKASPAAFTLTFDYDNTSNSFTATPNSDFVPTTTLTIAAGVTSASLSVAINGDSIVELDETVTVAVISTSSASVVIVDNVGEGIILNDDTYLYVAATDVSEGDVGVTTAVVRIFSSDPFPAGATITYFTPASTGTATSGEDYTSAQATLNLPSGAFETFVTVFVLGDTTAEATETFTLELTSGTGGVSPGSPAFGTVTIINDDGPSLSVADASVLEDSGSLVFTLVLDAVPVAPASVSASVFAGTGNFGSATPTIDFTPLRNLSVSFATGTNTTTVKVNVTADATPEPTETLSLLFNYPNYFRIPPTLSPTGRIVNDDGLQVGFLSASKYILPEGNSGITNFTFVIGTIGSATGLSTSAQVMLETIAGTATAISDYVPLSNQVVQIGAAPVTVTVQVVGDTIAEPTETYSVRLFYPDYVFFSSPATIDLSVTAKILGDDYFANISSVTLKEGDTGDAPTQFVFELAFTGPASEGSQLTYQTFDGTAISSASVNNDFVAIPSTLVNLTTGATGLNITVTVNPDSTPEVNETFTLALTNSFLMNIGTPSNGTGTIINDDYTLSIVDQSVFEGNSVTSQTMTFYLDGPAPAGATFRVQTVPGTAVAGTNYIAIDNVVNVTTGALSVNISVTIIGDTVPGASLSFSLSFSQISHIILSATSAKVTIINDDGPIITIAPASTLEGNTTAQPLVFVITAASAVTTAGAGFYIQTKKVTATVGDFVEVATPTFVNFTTGATSVSITVLTVPDIAVEDTETFEMVITNPLFLSFSPNASAAGLSATGTITNDDGLGIMVANIAQPEGTSNTTTPFIFTVSLIGGVAPAGASIGFTTIPGTATNPSDYTTTTGTISFATGATSATGTVMVVADSLDEAPETFFLTLNNPNKINIIGFTNASATILNDDGVITLAGPRVLEGTAGTSNPMVFNVSLSSAAPAAPGLASFTWAAVGITATEGLDFQTASGTFTFVAGTTTGTITIFLIGDDVAENDEIVALTITSVTNALAPVTSANGTIVNDDVQLNVVAQSFYEKDSSYDYQFPIMQTATATATATVTYTVSPLTNTIAGRDYILTSNTTLSLNQTGLITYVNFTILGDLLVQGDKSFVVTLTNCFGCIIGGSPSAPITLWEDDYNLAFSSSTYTVTETESTFNLNVTLVASQPLVTAGPNPTITVSTADGTAVSGSDYTSRTSTLSFQSGDSSAIFSIPILGDANPEPTETFSISMTNPVGLKIGSPSTSVVTILDNDARLIRVSHPRVSEGGMARLFENGVVIKNMSFVVSLSGPAMANSSVTYTTADGTATSSGSFADYVPVTGSHNFTVGETQFTVPVGILADFIEEASETLVLHIVGYTGALVTDSQTDGMGTIINDDWKAFGIEGVARGQLRVNNREL